MKSIHGKVILTLLGLCLLSTLHAQTPTLGNGTPNEAFIGEQFCFPITFENIGSPGYGPYVRLVIPPGFTFNSATFASGPQTIQNLGVVSGTAPNNFLIDPILDANGNPEPEDSIFAPTGSTIILLEYPVGSMVQGGVTLISDLCITVNPSAPIGIPENICVQGVYEYGNTATGVNGPIAAAPVCVPITPILYRFTKTGDELTLPGACHTYPYVLNVDIAAAGTLNGPIVFSDALPNILQFAGNLSLPAGCAATSTPSMVNPGGNLVVTCSCSFSGSPSNSDMVVSYDAYVVDTLDETFCDDTLIFNPASLAVPGNPDALDSVFTDVVQLDLGHGNNAGGPVSIGQTVLYTIGFDITEYTAGVNAASITFVVPDGMQYNPASLLWAGAPVLPANIVVVPGPGTGSTVTVDVRAQNGADILPCSSPTLTYTATVLQQYSTATPVLSRDRLTHTSSIVYDLVEGATGCTDAAGTSIDVVDISFQKTVVNSPPHPNGLWWPGDIVTYQLSLSIPSRDLDDVILTDFFPLPIHDVTSLAATFGTDVRFDPSTCWNTPPVTYTINAATNSLALDFGDISDNGTGACVDVVVLIDIAVTDQPFADGLFHSNFMQVNSDNSTADDITNAGLTLIQVAAPDLDITKGVLSSNNPNSSISPVVSPVDGNITNVDANDNITYQITIENQGGAPGFDVQIRDQVPAALSGCALVAPNPVQDGSGSAIAFTGGFVGNNLTINITDSISFSGAPGGIDLITVSYV